MKVLSYRKIANDKQHIESECELDLEQIVQLVSNPPDPISDEKNEQYLIYWGERIDDSISRIASNWGIRCAIILDYDGSLVDDEVKFDDFYMKYNGKFEFYMHSSWNDVIKGVDKYRVIIPVQNKYNMNPALKNVLLRIFKGCDKSTFDNRGFYIPVARFNYRYAISRGKILDISCFDDLVNKEIEAEHARQLEKARIREAKMAKYGDTYGSDEHKENWIRIVREDLSSFSWGLDGSGRYAKIRDTIYSMQKHKVFNFDEYEIEDLVDEYISRLSRENQRSLRKMIELG